MNHTATPWILREMSYGYDLAVEGIDGPNSYGGWIIELYCLDKDEEFKANAEFIIRACNAHDELVDAVKSAVEKLENYLSAIGPGYPSYRDLDQVQKVLRRAWAKAEKRSK